MSRPTICGLITHPEVRRDPKVRATADFLKRIAAGPDGLC
jgi:hypothetical protein